MRFFLNKYILSLDLCKMCEDIFIVSEFSFLINYEFIQEIMINLN